MVKNQTRISRNWILDESGGKLSIKHDDTGNEIEIDEETGELITDSLATEEARITDNQSVSVDLGRSYLNTAVTDDGTYYGLRKSDDDSDLVLDKTTEPFAPESWSEVNRWTGAAPSVNTGHGVYITSQGTLILGFDGSIQRSTDGGSSFTSVQSIGGSLWGISESSSGQVVATNYETNASDMLYESTDDGKTWSVLADDTDFGFADHTHKVDIHPQNDNIIVTGGDSNKLFYRSEDGGSTWTEFNALLTQYVAVSPHPTDGSVWYLGHDGGTPTTNDNAPRGIVKVTDNGGSDLTQEIVANFNIHPTNGAEGSFGVNPVYDADNDEGYLIADNHDANDEALYAWNSSTLDGTDWSAIAPIDEYAAGVTVQQGPYTSLDASTASAVVSHRAVDLDTATDPLYGRSPADIPYARYEDDVLLVHDFQNIAGKADLGVYYEGGGNYMFRAGATRMLNVNAGNGNVESRGTHQFWDAMQIPGSMAEDLTSVSPTDGEIRRHDGSGTPPAGLYHGSEDGSQWIGFGETSGTTI